MSANSPISTVHPSKLQVGRKQIHLPLITETIFAHLVRPEADLNRWIRADFVGCVNRRSSSLGDGGISFQGPTQLFGRAVDFPQARGVFSARNGVSGMSTERVDVI